jgi:hypothetical protein
MKNLKDDRKMAVDKSHPSMQLMCATCRHEKLAGDVYPCNCCWNPSGDMYQAKPPAPPPPVAPPPGYVTLQEHMTKVRQDPAKAAAIDRARVRLAAAWARSDDELIAAAEQHADLFNDQPEPLQRADLMNAVFVGARWQRKKMMPRSGDVRLLFDLIGDYFDIGVTEGKEGRSHDTVDGAAQRKWREIQEVVFRLAARPAS